MSYLGATMTLPGIAGFILTIGMGVDSNVLIFERIKEELQTAKGVKQAVAAGFDRVFLTILDTHVASLIAAAFLFQFGNPPIRGFATTLTIGMGVDSNVLIFERIKEELATAKGARAAVAAGFDRVFLTILDTHVASLIAAAFLFQFGTGPIRGFATTLTIGLLTNVFTSIFVSRTLFETLLSRRQARLSI